MDNTKLSIMYSNIRSLRNKIDELKCIVKNCTTLDIIILNETWLYINEVEYFNIEGYSAIHSCRSGRGGGAAIYIKNTLNYKCILNEYKNGCNWVGVEIQNYNIKIETVYRPPQSDLQLFLHDLDNLLQMNKKNLIIIGDINIDMFKTSNPTEDYKNVVQMNDCDFANMKTSTRKTQDTETLIDHIITNIRKDLFQIYFKEDPITDHKIQMIQVNKQEKIRKKKETIMLKLLDKESFLNECRHKMETTSIKDVDTLVELIQRSKEKHTKVKQKRAINNGWITNELLLVFKERDKLYERMKRNSGNEQLQEQFKRKKNECVKLVRRLKSEYINNRINKAQQDQRQTWKIINQIIKNDFSGSKHDQEITLVDDNDKTKDSKEVANKFNNYFTNIGRQLANRIKLRQRTKQEMREEFNNKTMYLIPCDEQEILKTINVMHEGKAPGWDGIDINTVKNLKEAIAPILAKLINNMLSTGVFPQSLKKGKIIPIYKSGDKVNVANYRPITTLSTFAKIYEKILSTRLTKFIEKTFQFDKRQYGFQSNSNTQAAITHVLNFIANNLDQHQYVVAIFVDLRKAFDTVDFEVLLSKLEKMGLRGKSYELIKSYLTQREQFVVIKGEESNMTEVTHGVPQGSVLGPLLYLLYVHSLSKLQMDAEYATFADDTVLLYSDSNLQHLVQKVEMDLKQYTEWVDANRLTINIDKTNYILFSQKNKKIHDITIRMCNEVLIRVQHIKYLGLTLDEKLTWRDHIDHIIHKLTPIAGALKRCSKELPNRNKRSIYYAMVEPLLRYQITAWGGASAQYLNKIRIIQNKVLKNLYNLHWRTPTQEVYKLTKVFPLHDLQFIEECSLAHKIIKNQIKHSIHLPKQNEVHGHNTRRCNQLSIESCNTNIKKNETVRRICSSYNQVPECIKGKHHFVTSLKNHLLQNNKT